MGDFELGARLLIYGGILLTFGGPIINNMFQPGRVYKVSWGSRQRQAFTAISCPYWLFMAISGHFWLSLKYSGLC